MPFSRVNPDDSVAVGQAATIYEAARQVDDPDEFPTIPAALANEIRYGWDLEPDDWYLYTPEPAAEPVALLLTGLPRRDNLHLMVVHVIVHPEHRRRGHGTVLLHEARRIAAAAGRTTIWAFPPDDDPGARAFATLMGGRPASRDARRRQVLAEVDVEEVARMRALAEAAATGYRLERVMAPTDDDTLAALVEVTAAINDAPMGELTYEDEHFDVQRLRDFEAAKQGSNELLYRVLAREEATGEIGGHTLLVWNPLRPEVGGQGDTAVSRAHRGHRLGLLLKIEMMRWLSEVQPQLTVIETFNNTDNHFMISVNEALGYRLSRTFCTFELAL